MSKLRLGPVLTEKPVKMTVELPAALHRDLILYAEILARGTGYPSAGPAPLVAPMLEHFIAADKEFVKERQAVREKQAGKET